MDVWMPQGQLLSRRAAVIAHAVMCKGYSSQKAEDISASIGSREGVGGGIVTYTVSKGGPFIAYKGTPASIGNKAGAQGLKGLWSPHKATIMGGNVRMKSCSTALDGWAVCTHTAAIAASDGWMCGMEAQRPAVP
eukprot:1147430-Pelagomonas_calceolata.AAC.2